MATTLPATLADVVRSRGGLPRLVVLLGLAAVLVAGWMLIRWATEPEYVTLYSGLELSEAGSVSEHLAGAGIPYRLGATGTDVQVRGDQVARARVLLAKDGLPQSGRPGLELFDKPSWGMTDFTLRVNYRRALEGELARTIGHLRGVSRAEVHLTLPETSPLRRLERPAQAAVVVALRPGATLPSDVVQGITFLVSNSVERLPASNVVLIDDAGHVLSVPTNDDSPAGISTHQLEIEHSVERYLSTKVEGLLATVLGPGQSRIGVSARLNFDQLDKTTETFDPDGQVLQTEQHSETSAGPADSVTGSSGVVSNSYQNSHSVERLLGSVGNVSRLTVAVVVNATALSAGAQAGAADGAARLAGLEALVRDAVGVDAARGDRITLQAMPFDVVKLDSLGSPEATRAEAESRGTDWSDLLDRFARPVLGLVGVVLLFLVGWRLVRQGGGASIPTIHALPATTSAPGGVAVASERRIQIAAEIAGQPEASVRVVRAWLAES
jgi:flagellar M-ring protein FliF